MPSDNVVPAAPPAPRRRWYRKPIALLTFFLLLLTAAAVGFYFYRTLGADAALREALAEADRADPHWRLKDIEARRPWPDDRENSALQVRAVIRLLPAGWESNPEAYTLLDNNYPPQARLNAAQLKALRADLPKAKVALAEAYKLKDMPRGRFPITYTRDFVSTQFVSQEARQAAQLLANDVWLLSEANEADRTLDACRAIVNCGRAIGDEPTLISMLIHVACRTMAVEGLERALAQGEPSLEALAAAQRAYADEAGESLLLIGLRGERGALDYVLQGIERGVVPMSKLVGPDMPPLERLELEFLGGVKRQRVALLKHMNQAVAIARRPSPEWAEAFARLTASTRGMGTLTGSIIPSVARIAPADQRSVGLLRCATAALAAERHRREHAAWPAGLKELAARGYLKEVPADPFDGAPLRWRRLKNGVVIYALGPDGQDNGGNLNRQDPNAAGSDIGFRLWDVPHRRQPPVEPPPAEPEEAPAPGPESKEP